jgi:hypothetical protein
MRAVYLVILAILIAAGITGLLYFSELREALKGHTGLPACESSKAQSEAKSAFENGPFAKTANIKIIAMTDINPVMSSDEEVSCEVTVFLNNAHKGTMAYSFTKNSSLPAGQYMIESQLELETFQPYP